MFELREMGSRFPDLSEYLDQHVTGLNPNERKEIGKGYGQLVNLMARLERVMNLPPPPTPTTPALPALAALTPPISDAPPTPTH